MCACLVDELNPTISSDGIDSGRDQTEAGGERGKGGERGWAESCVEAGLRACELRKVNIWGRVVNVSARRGS